MNVKPTYLARPSDGEVFSLNEDKETYSSKYSKEKWPDNIHNEYSYESLLLYDFYEVQESDFDELKQKNKEYHEYMSWFTRSDGHGGIKGGTLEEFRNLTNK